MRRALIGGAAVTTVVVAGAARLDAARPGARRPPPRRRPSRSRRHPSSGARWPRWPTWTGRWRSPTRSRCSPAARAPSPGCRPEASTLKRGSIAARIDDQPVDRAVRRPARVPAAAERRRGPRRHAARAQPPRARLRRRRRADRRRRLHGRHRARRQAAREGVRARRRTASSTLDEVVYLPDVRRVGEHAVEVGDRAGGKLYDTTARTRVVRIELDARKRSLVRRGKEVEVELPDERSLKGRISDVGRVVRSEDDGAGGTKAVLDVEVTVVGNPGATDGAPVAVHVVRTAVRGRPRRPGARAARARRRRLRRRARPTTRQIVPVELGRSPTATSRCRARASASARSWWWRSDRRHRAGRRGRAPTAATSSRCATST